ncbi:MAG: septal ring lytic transglycosylase RlpA family protein [Salinarimonas sp.]
MPDADAFGMRREATPVTGARGGALKVILVAGFAIALANCSGQTTPTAKVDPKYGVAASPLVVSDGSDVPRGGGREMVGRSYTIAGRTYTPRRDENYSNRGLASWYGPGFHGRQTANGEVFDQHAISAAHTTMPLPSYARVTNLENNRSLIVRVNDRGPFHGNRIIDVSKTVAEALDFRQDGVGRVQVDYVGPAHVDGSDDQILVSTLRTDGQMAQLPDIDTRPGGTMLAEAEPPTQDETPVTHASFAQAEPQRAVSGSQSVALAAGPLAVNSWQERAASPQRRPATGNGGGSVLAGLFFAQPAGETQALSRDSAFGGLATANQRSLRRTQ